MEKRRNGMRVGEQEGRAECKGEGEGAWGKVDRREGGKERRR